MEQLISRIYKFHFLFARGISDHNSINILIYNCLVIVKNAWLQVISLDFWIKSGPFKLVFESQFKPLITATNKNQLKYKSSNDKKLRIKPSIENRA